MLIFGKKYKKKGIIPCGLRLLKIQLPKVRNNHIVITLVTSVLFLTII